MKNYFKSIRVSKSNQIISIVGILLVMLMIPDIALASNPIENGLNFTLGLLNGPMARTIAGIALAIIGFMFFTGRMQMMTVGMWIVGMFVVFGGPAIVNMFASAI